MKRRLTLVIFTLLAIYTVSPFLYMLVAAVIAAACGATLNEAEPHPTMLLGVDIGDVLYPSTYAWVFLIYTIPSGAFALCLFGGLVLWAKRRGRSKSKTGMAARK